MARVARHDLPVLLLSIHDVSQMMNRNRKPASSSRITANHTSNYDAISVYSGSYTGDETGDAGRNDTVLKVCETQEEAIIHALDCVELISLA